MTDLPNGWMAASIEDTGQYINGLAFKPTDWKDVGTPIIRIKNLTDPEAPINRTTRTVPDSVKVTKGTILVSWSATLDAFIWNREDAVLNQHIFKVVPDERVVWKSFLYYLLRSEIAVMRDSDHLHGSTMKHINRGPFLAHRIALPPLAEQKRIADKLEAVLGRADACRARLDRVPDLLKRFRQSVLAAATSGQLTEDWREENRTATWQHLPLGSLASEVKNGLSPKPNEQPPGTPILRISSVRPFQVYQNDIRYLSADIPVDAYRLRIGDLLFTRYNGSLEFVGVCGLVRKIEIEGLVYPDKLIRVRVDERRVVPAWIEIAAGSPTVRDVIENTARTSAGQTGISGKDIRELVLPVPSLPEQAEIVRRVEALFALADRIEARLATAQRLVERLTPATLSKAFRGDLVPQDPNDEPASVLLERLLSDRDRSISPQRKRTPLR